MANIVNIDETWNGHSGLEVEKFIKDQLKSKLSSNTKAIIDIEYTASTTKLNTVNCIVTYSDGTKSEAKEITITPASSNVVVAAWASGEDSPELLLSENDGVTLMYKYAYQNETGTLYIAGLKATIQIYNSGLLVGTVPATNIGTTGTSSTNWRLGAITINSSMLNPGNNSLEIRFAITYNNATSFTSIYCNATLLSLTLDATVYGLNFDAKYYNLIESSQAFQIQYRVSAKGGINLSGYTITKDLYYGTNKTTYSTTGNETTLLTIDNLRGSSTDYDPIFVRAYVSYLGKTIYSNPVMLKLAVNGKGPQYSTKIIPQAIADVPVVNALQYENTGIQLAIYNAAGYTVVTTLDGEMVKESPIASNNFIEVFASNFNTPIVHNTNFSLTSELGASTTLLDVSFDVKSSGSSVAEPVNPILALSAAGKTNLSNKGIWNYGRYDTSFSSGFDWDGNGWIDDALVVNNGAVATINCPICSTSAYTFVVRFATRYSIYDEPVIQCLLNGYGFEIYPSKVKMYNAGTSLEAEFDNEDENANPVIHTIAVVRHDSTYQNLLEIYIDGVILKVMQSKSYWTHQSPITIKADKSNLYVYNIYAYNRNLSFSEILSLYGLNLGNSQAVLDFIGRNNIFDIDTTALGYYTNNITIDKLPIGSTYMVINSYGGKDSLDRTPWKTINSSGGINPDAEKGIRHLVGNIKLIHKRAEGEDPDPRNFCIDKATLSAQGTSSMAYPIKNFRFYFKKAIDKSCNYYNETMVYDKEKGGKKGDFGYTTHMYMGVPANAVVDEITGNLIIGTYTKKIEPKEEGKPASAKYSLFTINEDGYERDSAPAKLFCLKADFAESSGSHNTGFARLADRALRKSNDISNGLDKQPIGLVNLALLTPQQKCQIAAGNSAKYKNDIRTTIDGRPVYLFFQYTDETGEQHTVYHGKYNLNNEKSSEDVFGFLGCGDYYDNTVVKTEAANLKNLFKNTDFGRDYYLYFDDLHLKYTITDGEYDDGGNDFVNPNECWEFSTNSILGTNVTGGYNNIAAFLYPYCPVGDTSYPKYNQFSGFDPFTIKDTNGNLVWLNWNDGSGTEDSSHGEAWEYRFPGWETKIGELDDAHKLYLGTHEDHPNVQVPPFLLKSLYKWLYKHNITMLDESSKARVMAEFASNLHLYFNVNYLLKYYILTQWFGNVDQRIKNCMLSFYCDPDADNNDSTEYPMGHMRAYYIFYDNDTILGVDNAGGLTIPWNVQESSYPGAENHAIWQGLNWCYDQYLKGSYSSSSAIGKLGKMIADTYALLRTTISDPLSYFDQKQTDFYPEAAFNIDALIKYYKPSALNSASVDEPNRLPSEQGNRKPHRHKWLNKRTTWLDTKYKAGSYSKYLYKFKVNGLEGSDNSSGTIKLTSGLDNWRFHLTFASTDLVPNASLIQSNLVKEIAIPSKVITVSDFVSISGLYACTKLNLNDLNVNTYILDLESDNKLPYMKELVVSDSTVQQTKGFDITAFDKLVSNNGEFLFPNLEKLYICKLVPYSDGQVTSRFNKLDLKSNFSINTIDASNTPIDIELPSGEALTTLSLQNPLHFTAKNKRNLNSFQIADVSELLDININNVSKVVYEWALRTGLDKETAPNVTSTTIHFSNGGTPYTLSNSELTHLTLIARETIANKELIASKLLELATDPDKETKLQAFINTLRMYYITGLAKNPNVTVELRDLFDLAFGDSLLITSEYTGDFEITSGTTTSLREGESITFFANRLLASADDWEYDINGEISSNLGGKLIVEKSKTKITFTHTPAVDNNEALMSYTLKVRAYLDKDTEYQQVAESVNIPIQYIKVEYIEIVAEDDKFILGDGDETKILIKGYPSTNTKLPYLDTQAKILGNWTIEGLGSLNTDTLNFKLTTKDNAYLTLAIAGVNEGKPSNTLEFLYDKLIVTMNTAGNIGSAINRVSDATGSGKTSESLFWIYKVIYDLPGVGVDGIGSYNSVYISTLHKIDLSNYYRTSIPTIYAQTLNGLDAVGDGISFTHDFEFMKYFSFGSSKFTLWDNQMHFTNLTLPKSVVTAEWNCSGDYSGYGNIVFNSKIEGIKIALSTNKVCSNLQFDLSNCDNIKTICNSSASGIPYGIASFNLTVGNIDDPMPSTDLFKYPKYLETLGNYEFPGSDVHPGAAVMLHRLTDLGTLANFDAVTSYPPAYRIPGSALNTINLGPVYSYVVTSTQYPNLQPGNIKALYYTYWNGFVTPSSGQSFDLLEIIGKYSFYNSDANVTINQFVKFIGKSAFNMFRGELFSKDRDSSTLSGVSLNNFLSVGYIDTSTFSTMGNPIGFKLSSEALSLGYQGYSGIGSRAFSTAKHVVYITGSSVFPYDSTSFGEFTKAEDKVTVHMTEALSKKLRENNAALYDQLAKNAIIITDVVE